MEKENAAKIMEQVDLIKDKITSSEYLILSNLLKKLWVTDEKLYKVTIYYCDVFESMFEESELESTTSTSINVKQTSFLSKFKKDLPEHWSQCAGRY